MKTKVYVNFVIIYIYSSIKRKYLSYIGLNLKNINKALIFPENIYFFYILKSNAYVVRLFLRII